MRHFKAHTIQVTETALTRSWVIAEDPIFLSREVIGDSDSVAATWTTRLANYRSFGSCSIKF